MEPFDPAPAPAAQPLDQRLRAAVVWLLGHAARLLPFLVLATVVSLTWQALRGIHPTAVRHALHSANAAGLQLALAGTLIASQATTTSKSAKIPVAASSVGKIEKYEAANRTLTLSTTKGQQAFVLAANATIREGSKSMRDADIASKIGQRAKVRYSEATGQKTAEAVMILSPTTSMASAQKPASK